MKSFYTHACLGAAALLTLGACDSLLDRAPKDELTEDAVYSNYESIKTYAWQLYDAFPAYDQINSGQGNSNHDKLDEDRSTVQLRRGMRDMIMWADFDSDLMDQGADNGESDWIWQRYDIPTSSYDYTGPYRNIRAINWSGSFNRTDRRREGTLAERMLFLPCLQSCFPHEPLR